MSRTTRFQWLSRRVSMSPRRLSTRQRRLHCEILEDRRLLTVTVDTLVDENNGVFFEKEPLTEDELRDLLKKEKQQDNGVS